MGDILTEPNHPMGSESLPILWSVLSYLIEKTSFNAIDW